MLFDLRGRRRRAVQGTYLMLALLMGGGLLFAGIGSDVNGGLLDVFKGGDDSNSSNNPAVEKRIKSNEAKLKTSPTDTTIIAELIRDEYNLANAQLQPGATSFPKESRDELRKVDVYWKRYLTVAQGRPNPDLAKYALQVYDPAGLNKPKDAEAAAQIIARDGNDTNSYLNLVQYAALAGDTRTADLAAVKAVDLAPKNQRKAVKAQAEQLKKPQTTTTP
jgi:hypothetical protein